MSLSIFFLAAENSGDQLGANLMRFLSCSGHDLHVSGIGGTAMLEWVEDQNFDISRLSVLGFTEALRVYGHVLERVRSVCDIILEQNPDVVVLIDSWGFMVRVAKRLKALGYQGKVVKYVAPQVWAMRSGRAKILAKYVDYLISIQPMDKAYFDAVGLANDYAGNPMFDEDFSSGNRAALRQSYNIPETAPIIGVFFGSRLSELKRLSPCFADAIMQVKAQYPEAYFISPMAENIAEDVLALAGQDQRLQNVILLPEERKKDVYATIDLALACSGTVTTQLASVGIPTIVAYRVSALTYHVAKHLFKPDYMSLVNIAADKALMPEFMQNAVSGDSLSKALIARIKDPLLQKSESHALLAQTRKMRGDKQDGMGHNKDPAGKASDRAAKLLLSYMGYSD